MRRWFEPMARLRESLRLCTMKNRCGLSSPANSRMRCCVYWAMPPCV